MITIKRATSSGGLGTFTILREEERGRRELSEVLFERSYKPCLVKSIR